MKKMNNEGFSLVELIIVIAIMAILVGVLAPQYLKYVERSRQSADISAIDSVMTAMEIAAVDPASGVESGETMTAIFSADGLEFDYSSADDTTKAAVIADLTETVGDYTLRSGWRENSITIKAAVSNGLITFTLESADHVDIKAYSATLASKIDTFAAPSGSGD